MSVSSPRDLAWCRAAFRDLDAPLPGQAAGPGARTAPRRTWSTGPIEPGPLAARLGPRPDTSALVERAVARSGYAPRRIDSIGATLIAWDEITRVGAAHLQAEAAAARALGTVRERWDLREPMLWDFFGHHGELGVVAHHAVVHDLYTSGGLQQTLVAAIDSGSLLRY